MHQHQSRHAQSPPSPAHSSGSDLQRQAPRALILLHVCVSVCVSVCVCVCVCTCFHSTVFAVGPPRCVPVIQRIQTVWDITGERFEPGARWPSVSHWCPHWFYKYHCCLLPLDDGSLQRIWGSHRHRPLELELVCTMKCFSGRGDGSLD